jgi:hypothetical protein
MAMNTNRNSIAVSAIALLAAETDEAFDRAMRKVSILCDS